jgi:ferrochelatase
MTERKKIGVVLFQLGGPDSRQAVEPFLYNLFCDPDIIDFPLAWIARKPLARFIARRRGPKVAEKYAEIGGASPIRLLTDRQAQALESALRPHVEPFVAVAMRYWHPFTEEAVQQLASRALDEIVLLPLYPQYSRATTGSSLNEWRRRYSDARLPVRLVKQFYDHPLYLDAVVDKINLALTHFDKPDEAHLVFSAHGVPVSFIEGGDPYQGQVEATVRLVRERGGWPNAGTLCYQSKVGPQKWLEPSLDDTIHRLAVEKCRDVLVIPIAFVSEHIETLHEINIETRAEAEQLGIERFEMMPAVNDSPKFIAALADLVLQAVGMGSMEQGSAGTGQQKAASSP